MDNDRSAGIVIVGAGHAGGRAAQTLREAGWSGPITLVGAEPEPPYERPPLSKGLLRGERSAESCRLHADGFYGAHAIDRRRAVVCAIDRNQREVELGAGRRIPYHRLLLATGAEPRRLNVPGADLDGILVLRDLADARRLAETLGRGQRLVIVGGGLIGLEVAASAVGLGVSVSVIEAAPRLMGRAVPEAIAERMMRRHRHAGVEIHLSTGVRAFAGKQRIEAVVTSDGRELPADIVLLAVGVVPRTDLAERADLDVENGIKVDASLRTSDPAIFAIGDAVSFPHPLYGRRVRLEHWKNAEDQAARVARTLLGDPVPPMLVPWFWSDQYELTLQVAGLADTASVTVRRDLGTDATLYFQLDRDGRLVAASGVGPGTSISRDIKVAQMLIERRLTPDPDELADPALRLKSLLN